ncbi:MAG: PqqD family protein [Clostridiales bacterium]|nr:PqqD family protein [Clostridiales bacterium]
MKKQKKNYLDFVPELSEKISFEKDKAGKVTVLVQNKGVFNRIAQKLFNKPPVTKVHLDDCGSYILPQIDGRRTVMELALIQKARFGEAVEPLYPRFVKYMQIMERCGFVKMKQPD